MFTGIVTDKGRVAKTTQTDRGRRLVVECGFDTAALDIGASVACSGICLTVVDKNESGFTVDVAAETLDKTTAGDWQVGSVLNLERSLRLGDELGGHMVSGHVDGLAEVVDRKPDGDAVRFRIRAHEDHAPFIAPKGSVTLDGVSLTVNEVDGNVFGVCIIPHTLQKTTFGDLQKGDRINLEVDMLARYVARLMRAA